MSSNKKVNEDENLKNKNNNKINLNQGRENEKIELII
jgi:hypothetical protein